MKYASALGIFVSFSLFMSCAPVASSSPKLAQQRRGDSGVVDTGAGKAEGNWKFGVVSDSQIVTEAQAKDLDETLRDYKIEQIKQNDAEFFELRDKHRVEMVKLSVDPTRIDIKTIFVLNSTAKELEGHEVKVNWVRDEKELNQFSFSIDEEKTSEATWALIKKSLVRVTFAHRTSKPEAKK